MKFVCDSCHAQYMISDEKVGPNGVSVRCKKCQNKIIVKRPAPTDEGLEQTVVTTALAPPEDTASNPVAEAAEAASGFDDELGRAFESVLTKPAGAEASASDPAARPTIAEMPFAAAPAEPAASPFAAAGEGGTSPFDESADTDRESTRVVNLSAMADLIKAEAQQERNLPAPVAALAAPAPAAAEEKPKKNGTNGTAAAADWFVAIDDSQVGPLNFEAVRERWEKGELSADSLCWKPGLPDWKPLSSVPELADQLAPRPAPAPEKELPAGATATGAQAAAPAPIPPKQEEPGEPEWKPSAASALESLVNDELEALQKAPAPKPVEESPAEARPRGGLFDELPDAPAEKSEPGAPRAPEPAPAQPLAAASLPAAPAAPAFEERRPAPRPAYAEPAPYVPAQPPKSKVAPYLMIGIPVTLLAIAVIVVGVVLATRQPVVVAQVPAPPQVAVAAPVPTPTATPTPTPTPTPPAPVEPGPAAATPTPPAVAVAPPTEPAKVAAAPAEPEKAAAPATPDKPAVAAPDKPDEKAEDKPDKPVRVATRSKTPREPRVAPREREPDPEPVVAAPSKPVSKGSIDDDFDKIFGPGAAEPEPRPKPQPRRNDTYIPPAPGSGGDKVALEQSDVMRVVVENKAMIKRCTDEAKAADPSSSGTIVMRWTIRPNGTVTNIQTATAEYQKTRLSACLAGGIKTFRFPAYTGKQMAPINFPFKF